MTAVSATLPTGRCACCSTSSLGADIVTVALRAGLEIRAIKRRKRDARWMNTSGTSNVTTPRWTVLATTYFATYSSTGTFLLNLIAKFGVCCHYCACCATAAISRIL